jgi:hypothetical protein
MLIEYVYLLFFFVLFFVALQEIMSQNSLPKKLTQSFKLCPTPNYCHSIHLDFVVDGSYIH